MNQHSPKEPDSSLGDDALIGRALWVSLGLLLVAAGGAGWWFGWGRAKSSSLPVVSRITLKPPVFKPYLESQASPFNFQDVTEIAGLGGIIPNGAVGQKLLPETMAGGCTVFDYDSDGDSDVLTVGNNPWQDDAADKTSALRLYQNDGTGQFIDVTDAAKLGLSVHGMGASAADFNNDGLVDLFVTCVGPNRLLRNRGGWFEDITDIARVAGDAKAWSSSSAWWDYDHDGDLDLFVANYVAWSRDVDLQLDCTTTGTGRSYCRPELFSGSHVCLYRNDGDNHFTDVSQAAGLVVKDKNTGSLMGKSLSLVAVDLDYDGWLDFVITNDTTANFVFHNQKNGTFREIGAQCGIGFDHAGQVRRQFGMDAAWLPEVGGWGIVCGTPVGEALAFFRTRSGSLQFTDDTMIVGLGRASRVPEKFTPLFCDFDLDGRLDLFVANGRLNEDLTQLRAGQIQGQTSDLYWNIGDGQFRRVPPEIIASPTAQPLTARGIALADFDRDADPDVLIATNGGTLRLLRNNQHSGHRWYRIVADRPEAIGARIELTAGGVKQVWLANPHRGYLSQSESAVTFGLGTAKRVDRLVVYWTNGEVWDQTNLPVNQILTLSKHSVRK
jgi:hypothetical protein